MEEYGLSADQLLASATRFLIDGQEEDAAKVLLSCSLALDEIDSGWNGSRHVHSMAARARGPRPVYEILSQDEHPITKSICDALNAVLPEDWFVSTLMPERRQPGGRPAPPCGRRPPS